MSVPSFQFLHFNSFISIDSCQFMHFMHFISFQFTSSQLTMNSYKPHPFFETSAPARAGHYLVGFGARLDRPKYMFQRRFRDAWVRGPFWQLLVIMSWYCCSIKLPSNIILHSTPIRPRESPAKNTQKQLQVWQMSEIKYGPLQIIEDSPRQEDLIAKKRACRQLVWPIYRGSHYWSQHAGYLT